MKAKFSYSLTFIVGGVMLPYDKVAPLCGVDVVELTRDNVYSVRTRISLLLACMGFKDVNSELVCNC